MPLTTRFVAQRRRRPVFVVSCAAWILFAATMPAYGTTTLVEAERGAIDNASCGDDGPMAVVNHATASGGKIVFHPGSGCSQSFSSSTRISLSNIRYFTTGYVGVHCGRFVVSGGISTSSSLLCEDNDTWITASFASATGSGSYQIQWLTEGSTPSWVNAYVDFHTTVPENVPPPPPPPAVCSDGVDNDADGRQDYPADPGCTSSSDASETPDPQCFDRLDNDGDGAVDYGNDPGCSSDRDTTEDTPQCADGRDNDFDGRTDYPADTGCVSSTHNAEAPDPECSDGQDNDADNRIDYPADPGCHWERDSAEAPDPECGDQLDNDGNGTADYPSDPGCESTSDGLEYSFECSDGKDNDFDGLVDSSDWGCESDYDDAEFQLCPGTSGGSSAEAHPNSVPDPSDVFEALRAAVGDVTLC